jgi:outer membrane lipoprotein-sorting protein
MPAARHVAIALVLLAGLALAGCTLSPQDSPYPADSEVRSQLTSLETLQADVVTTTLSNGTETTTRVRLVRNFTSDGVRSTTVSGNASGQVLVSNGTRTWYYTPTDNRVRRYAGLTNGSDEIQRTVDQMTSIYDELRDGEDADGSIGISPAPTVPAEGSGSSASRQLVIPLAGNVSVIDEGTATVDGRSTRVVRLVGTGDADYVRNATYWIDAEWHLPIKSRITVQVGDRTSTVTTTYTNLTVNEPVDPDRFTYEPPPTATVVEGTNGSLRSYEERSELEAATPHAVPEPDLPESYEFTAAELAPVESSQSITLIYSGSADTLTVTKIQDYEADLDEGEPVEVGGNPGRLVDAGGNTALVWRCNGNSYSVVGAGSAPLEEVASSMACA